MIDYKIEENLHASIVAAYQTKHFLLDSFYDICNLSLAFDNCLDVFHAAVRRIRHF